MRNRLRVLRDRGLSPQAIELVSSMMRHDRHTRPTVREALQHPFFQVHSEQEAVEKLREQRGYRELDRKTEETE